MNLGKAAGTIELAGPTLLIIERKHSPYFATMAKSNV